MNILIYRFMKIIKKITNQYFTGLLFQSVLGMTLLYFDKSKMWALTSKEQEEILGNDWPIEFRK